MLLARCDPTFLSYRSASIRRRPAGVMLGGSVTASDGVAAFRQIAPAWVCRPRAPSIVAGARLIRLRPT